MSNELKMIQEARAKRERNLVQYSTVGNVRVPTTNTIETMEAGSYAIRSNMQGIYFELIESNSDDILKFEDERFTTITEEVSKFWAMEENFKKLGMTMKRGILMYGPPGSGKTCLLHQLEQEAIDSDNIVVHCSDPYIMTPGLKLIREVEPNRKILVLIEDIDTVIRHSETQILELFDGPNQQDKVCFVATTNYIERLPPRILRSGRFDRKTEIGQPPKAGRLAYLQAKLGVNEDSDKIDELVEKTDGFSFADLREFIIAAYCFEEEEEKVLTRIKKYVGKNENYSEEDIHRYLMMRSLDEIVHKEKKKKVITEEKSITVSTKAGALLQKINVL